MRLKVSLTISCILFLALGIRSIAQEWIVPEDQKGKVSPFLFTPEMKKQGEQLYQKNCQSCHGIPGKNNFAKLNPPPGDLSLEKAQKQKDGEFFYRITTGKTPMPEFRNIIAEDERWWIISYLRTFNPKYVQPTPVAKGVFTGKVVQLQMTSDIPKKKIRISALEMLNDQSHVPLQGAEVVLSVKRYFGYMQIGEIQSTNARGITEFDIPPDLPGNKSGMIELMARVNDPKGVIKASPVMLTAEIGLPTDQPSLIATRDWWTTRMKAPIWVILTYSLAVMIVWGFIFYILYDLFRIRKLNKT